MVKRLAVGAYVVAVVVATAAYARRVAPSDEYSPELEAARVLGSVFMGGTLLALVYFTGPALLRRAGATRNYDWILLALFLFVAGTGGLVHGVGSGVALWFEPPGMSLPVPAEAAVLVSFGSSRLRFDGTGDAMRPRSVFEDFLGKPPAVRATAPRPDAAASARATALLQQQLAEFRRQWQMHVGKPLQTVAAAPELGSSAGSQYLLAPGPFVPCAAIAANPRPVWRTVAAAGGAIALCVDVSYEFDDETGVASTAARAEFYDATWRLVWTATGRGTGGIADPLRRAWQHLASEATASEPTPARVEETRTAVTGAYAESGARAFEALAAQVSRRARGRR